MSPKGRTSLRASALMAVLCLSRRFEVCCCRTHGAFTLILDVHGRLLHVCGLSKSLRKHVVQEEFIGINCNLLQGNSNIQIYLTLNQRDSLMFTRYSLSALFALAALISNFGLQADSPTPESSGQQSKQICCLKRAYCCSIKAKCCSQSSITQIADTTAPVQTVSSAGEDKISDCCAAQADCCFTGSRCCLAEAACCREGSDCCEMNAVCCQQ